MKKISSIIIALIMLVNLAACGGKSAKSEDPNIGMWNAISASMLGTTQDIIEVFEQGVSLELKSNGKFNLNLDGEKATGKWSYKDGGLSLSRAGLVFSGNIQNGILTLENLMDLGLDLVFEKQGGHPDYRPPTIREDSGYYIVDRATEDGETFTGDELREMGFDYYVVLNEDGTAVCQTDDLATGTWKTGVMNLDDGEGNTISLNYEIKGDELTIDWGGLLMVYVRSSGTPPEPSAGTVGLSEVQQWWDGDWYGYWESHSVTDDYNHLDDGRWDIFAVIEMNSDDTGILYLWENGEDFATVDITVSEFGGAGDMGAAISESGHYWNGDAISHADWIIDPSLYGYENYMVIDGRYVDSEDEGFNYVVYLRPWGDLWDDNPEDERPPWYEDWYLTSYNAPMLEAIQEIDGFVHTELAETLATEKPAPSGPSGGAATEKPAPSGPSGGAATEKPAPSAPAGGPIEVSYEMGDFLISAILPAQGWCPKNTAFGYDLYQVKSCDEVYSNSPRIRINIKPELKDFNRNSADFENVQPLKNRTIGGIDLAGRSYQFVGMDWIEYTGLIDNTHAVSVNTSKIDISTGEGSAVIDSLKFTSLTADMDVTGERVSAGNVSALLPDGWKSYPVWDLWAEKENTPDKDKLKFNKGAKSEDDQHFTPSIEIRYYGINSSFIEPGKDRFEEAEDWGPVNIGGRIWKGITGLSWGSKQALIWAKDGDDEFLIAILLEYDGKKISLQDADVRAILASITAP